MPKQKYKYLFGPVPSRRLGRSLGVDIVPLKTCTQNCIYCQLGKDAPQILERSEYVPIESVLEEALGHQGPSFIEMPVVSQDEIAPFVPKWVSSARKKNIPNIY